MLCFSVHTLRVHAAMEQCSQTVRFPHLLQCQLCCYLTSHPSGQNARAHHQQAGGPHAICHASSSLTRTSPTLYARNTLEYYSLQLLPFSLFFLAEYELCAGILSNLLKVARFSTVIMFLEEKEKKGNGEGGVVWSYDLIPSHATCGGYQLRIAACSM